MQNPKQFQNFENAQWLVEPVVVSASGYEHPVTDFKQYVGEPTQQECEADAV